MTNELIFAWLVGLAILMSLMAWWFDTRLPIHVFCILRRAGWRKHDETFWKLPTDLGVSVPFGDLTRADLDEWMGLRFRHLVAELLSCPGCLSAHLAFWISVGFQGVVGPHVGFFLAGWLGWPGVALFLRALRPQKK